MNLRPSLLVFAAALMFPSCVTLQPDASRVEIVDSRPEGAEFLGRVSQGVAGAGALFSQSSYQAAVNGLLNKTAAMGGTHLVLDESSRDPRFWGFSQHVQGNAYRQPR